MCYGIVSKTFYTKVSSDFRAFNNFDPQRVKRAKKPESVALKDSSVYSLLNSSVILSRRAPGQGGTSRDIVNALTGIRSWPLEKNIQKVSLV